MLLLALTAGAILSMDLRHRSALLPMAWRLAQATAAWAILNQLALHARF